MLLILHTMFPHEKYSFLIYTLKHMKGIVFSYIPQKLPLHTKEEETNKYPTMTHYIPQM